MASDDVQQVLSVMEARLREQSRRWLFVAVALVGLAIPGTMLAGSITVPNTFLSGTVAKASEVNANFATLTSEATRVSNIVSGPGDGTNTNSVKNLAAPIAANDAANKAYADASGSSGGSITLLGTTTCPAGWAVALAGMPFFSAYTTNGYNGSPTYACMGLGVTTNAVGGNVILASPAYWAAHAGDTCVICVK